ncbi:MAG: methionyl-tRNA formyltransferase [Patescibacteria group bacterium]|nr:methionyl-tRNA formyltransferase [Patescibacteria group bacterium]
MLAWLKTDGIDVVGAAHLEYLFRFSANPFNLLFVFSYWLHKNKFFHSLNIILWYFMRLCKPFLTSVYEKYFEHVDTIISRNIEVIDIENADATEAYMKEKGIDLIIINSWSLLPATLVSTPQYGSVNIHPSELPKYRGALPTLWSLKNNDTMSAVTYMLAREKADNGEILSQHQFQIEAHDNWLSLEQKIDAIVENTFVKDVLAYINESLVPKSQQGQATGTGKYQEYLKIVPAQENVKDILNKVGLYPYLEPFVYCYILVAGKEIHIKSAMLSVKLVPVGAYMVSGCQISIGAVDGTFSSKLFMDVPFLESLFLVFHRKGSLG